MKDEKLFEDLTSSVTNFVIKNQKENTTKIVAIIMSVFVTVLSLFYKNNGYSKEEMLDTISKAVNNFWETDNTTKS